ncbi:NAD-binding protein [Nocardioides zeae]|uniref:Voltage-gated potassium channel n=1 Tax=Nocardioides zeae TaxID=1457234 RepID=A0AAJ1U522_9ACTN|nr:NAD-binding protein [Nocardioides zeae]MDQ1105723.1 voltage-gated potassium channel [Nocardioides zeae]
MVFVLARLWARMTSAVTWRTPLLVLLTVFVTSWGAMALLDRDSGIADPGHYWWWFLVTASTVGYGDFFPTTTGGRIVGAYVVLGGVVTLTTFFTHLAATLATAKGRRMHGLLDHDLADHLVLVGWTPGRTDRLVADLRSDGTVPIVVCAWEDQLEQHPLPETADVHFVRGDLTDLAVLRRAHPESARAVLVDARDDNEAVTLTVAAEEAAPGVHTVVTLRDVARRRTIRRIDATVHCVQWHALGLVFDELSDPGIAEVYDALMTPGGPSTWSTVVPAGATATYGAWQQALGPARSTTLLAVAVDGDVRVSPAWDTPVPAGAVLYYVGPARIEPADLRAALA